MELKEIDLTKIEPDLRKAVEILIEIGTVAEEVGTDDIDIDKDTLSFLSKMMPSVEALISTKH